MNTPLVKLYVLCYIYHRCQRIHDNLVEIFQALVSYYHTKASQTAKEYLGELKSSFESSEDHLADILDFYTNNIRDSLSFSTVRKEALKRISAKKIKSATSYMREKNQHHNQVVWTLLGEAQIRFKKNLRHIFKALTFISSDQKFNVAINFLR